uniref:Nucleoporin Nup133/Nup155-like N-terminal domain-containing protein n=1 Tax=Timema poppense TaxID=170557 RepID=A0A7R9CIZ6_TIMPO|nr:unnamed protein product [Timema poppensis]
MVREEDEGWEESTGWRLESRLKGRGGCKGQNDKYKNIRNTTMERSYSVDPSRIQVDSLEMAGKMLEKQMTKDNSFPSLLDLTGILPEAQSSTLSGLSERDYPSANSIPGGNDNVSHLALYDKVFIPPEVVEHFGHMQCNCTMGLFAEISRAWLTIDSDIYVWTYENGNLIQCEIDVLDHRATVTSNKQINTNKIYLFKCLCALFAHRNDVAFFDGLGESIISVGLVKPKSGVFNTFVRHLLVLTTLSEIIVLGVTFSSKSTARTWPRRQDTSTAERVVHVHGELSRATPYPVVTAEGSESDAAVAMVLRDGAGRRILRVVLTHGGTFLRI